MAKKIRDEQGNVYVQNKPFYKKLWFLVVAGFLVFAILGKLVNGGGSSPSSTPKEDTATTSSSAKQAKPTYSFGDQITFEKEAAITLTGAAYTDERNQFEKSEPLHVLVVTYTVENLSDKDYVVGSELELYVNGKKMDTYPVATTFSTLSAGRIHEGATQAFAITEEGDYELEVEPSISFTSKPVVIPFTVQ